MGEKRGKGRGKILNERWRKKKRTVGEKRKSEETGKGELHEENV